eukprot:34763-Eustigmatos_ZCMA.PRE.1
MFSHSCHLRNHLHGDGVVSSEGLLSSRPEDRRGSSDNTSTNNKNDWQSVPRFAPISLLSLPASAAYSAFGDTSCH